MLSRDAELAAAAGMLQLHESAGCYRCPGERCWMLRWALAITLAPSGGAPEHPAGRHCPISVSAGPVCPTPGPTGLGHGATVIPTPPGTAAEPPPWAGRQGGVP